MTSIARALETVVARVCDGAGAASRQQRRAAFANAGLDEPLRTLVRNVALASAQVTDEEVLAAKAAGSSEAALFELVVCAAIGQSARQHDVARAALAAALTKEGS